MPTLIESAGIFHYSHDKTVNQFTFVAYDVHIIIRTTESKREMGTEQ